MQDNVLLPEIESMQDGEGPAVNAAPACCHRVTLGITQTLEREELDVAIWGSPDGQDWGLQPLAEFPRKSYCGIYSVLLDLSAQPGIRHLRAAWKMRALTSGRTAAEPREPLFGFYVKSAPVENRAAAA